MKMKFSDLKVGDKFRFPDDPDKDATLIKRSEKKYQHKGTLWPVHNTREEVILVKEQKELNEVIVKRTPGELGSLVVRFRNEEVAKRAWKIIKQQYPNAEFHNKLGSPWSPIVAYIDLGWESSPENIRSLLRQHNIKEQKKIVDDSKLKEVEKDLDKKDKEIKENKKITMSEFKRLIFSK